MKRFLPLVIVFYLCVFCTKAFSQVTQFPYVESFENTTFTQGTNVYFINNWFGNHVDNIRVFQEQTNVKSGTSALGLWPIPEEGVDSEEIELVVNVYLNLA